MVEGETLAIGAAALGGAYLLSRSGQGGGGNQQPALGSINLPGGGQTPQIIPSGGGGGGGEAMAGMAQALGEAIGGLQEQATQAAGGGLDPSEVLDLAGAANDPVGSAQNQFEDWSDQVSENLSETLDINNPVANLDEQLSDYGQQAKDTVDSATGGGSTSGGGSSTNYAPRSPKPYVTYDVPVLGDVVNPLSKMSFGAGRATREAITGPPGDVESGLGSAGTGIWDTGAAVINETPGAAVEGTSRAVDAVVPDSFQPSKNYGVYEPPENINLDIPTGKSGPANASRFTT